MNVFVTGATGKVGSRFAQRFVQRGHKVKILVRDCAKANSLQKQGIEVIEGDLLRMETLANALQGIDVVVHLAAQFRGVDEATARMSNIDASINLASAALKANVPRFVFASTNLVYGSGKFSRPSREDDELRPAFLYPQTKAAAEDALLRLHREQGQQESTEAIQEEYNPWDMIVDTTRIRDELNYRPIFPSFYTARDAGAL